MRATAAALGLAWFLPLAAISLAGCPPDPGDLTIPTTGVCCSPHGVCSLTDSRSRCEEGGQNSYLEDVEGCDGDPCFVESVPRGACCKISQIAECIDDRAQESCEAENGFYISDESRCATGARDLCDMTGACCIGDEACVYTIEEDCEQNRGGEFKGVRALCESCGERTLQWSSEDQELFESEGPAVLEARLSYISQQTVSATLVLAGDASYPDDIGLVPTTIEIPPNTRTYTLQIELIEDLVTEGTENLSLILLEPVNAVLGSENVSIVTILDDDTPTVAWTAASQTVPEGRADVQVTAELSFVSTLPVVVHYETAGSAQLGSDHTLMNGTLSIPAGQTTATLSFDTIEDAESELIEELQITMTSVEGAYLGSQTVHTVRIYDPPKVGFATPGSLVLEGEPAVVDIIVGSPGDDEIRVPVTVSGSASNPEDHDLVPSEIVIPPGQGAFELRFNTVDDDEIDIGETVIITLGDPTNAELDDLIVHTVTIEDDDVDQVWDFEDAGQINHWMTSASFGARTHDPAFGHSGGSLRVEAAYQMMIHGDGWLFHNLAAGEDFTGKTVVAWLYVPAAFAAAGTSGPYVAEIRLMDTSMGVEKQPVPVPLTGEGWVEVSWDLAASPPLDIDQTIIGRVALEVRSSVGDNTDWVGDLWIDDIYW